ncbi:MAG TPA: putative quinol monooxygenase [Rhizomicrobium sp.]|jgi:quinol monooxygenase YgiN|nr:putative quinol monooxygenase [Rhizomicrobium sp.]
MAIGVIATLKVQPGKGPELEAAFERLAALVRENEQGNMFYHLCRSRTENDTYVVMEMYRDQAALEAHGKSEHFRSAGPAIGACLAGRPDIRYLDSV